MSFKTMQSVLMILLSLSVLSSCTNGTKSSKLSKTSGAVSTSFGAFSPVVDSGPAPVVYAIQIQNVIPTKVNPQRTLDLIGDGTLSIGTNCYTPQTGSNSGGNASNRCLCEYSSGVTVQSLEPILVEQNMMRCPNPRGNPDIIATAIKNSPQVQIRIVSTEDGSVFSNRFAINFDLLQTAAQYLTERDLVSVKRYQCIERLSIPNIFDPTMYDPFQSYSPLLSFPLNFYTSNMAEAVRALSNSSGDSNPLNWDCDLDTNSPAPWVNLPIYSLRTAEDTDCFQDLISGNTSLSNQAVPPVGCPTLFDPIQNKDRDNFYVARTKIPNVFETPVHELIAPLTPSSDYDENGNIPAGEYPPLGFAMKPNPNCNHVTPPTGFVWKKLWAFEGETPIPSYVSKIDTDVTGLDFVACNPGRIPSKNNSDTIPLKDIAKNAIFQDCEEQVGGNNYVNKYALRDIASNEFAARYFNKRKACYSILIQTDPVCATLAGADAATINLCNALVSPGSSTFQRIGSFEDAAPNNGLNSSYFTRFKTPASADVSTGHITIPFSEKSASNTLRIETPETAGGKNLKLKQKTDYIFVVTPQNITRDQMSTADISVHDYIPRRFLNKIHCPPPNPNLTSEENATRLQNCTDNQEKAYIRYHLREHQIGGQTVSGQEVYPLCVLQPIRSGS